MTAKVALVTGASRGIGRAVAEGLAADGYAVAVNFRRDEESARAVVAAIRDRGGTATAYRAAVGHAAEEERLVADVVGAFGRIDVLVSNAGIASRGLPVERTTREEVERVFAVHALAAHSLCRLVLPGMRERREGAVVVVSSTATRDVPAGAAPYTMAKAALEALARTIAAEEVGNGIRANVVAPGLADTDMGRRRIEAIQHGKVDAALGGTAPATLCQPGQVADAVRYLVSSRAAGVNGQTVYLDGDGGSP